MIVRQQDKSNSYNKGLKDEQRAIIWGSVRKKTTPFQKIKKIIIQELEIEPKNIPICTKILMKLS